VDTYKTIASPAEGLYKEQGSKFLSFAYPVTTPEAVKLLVDAKRKEFHDARHVCYAYMLGSARTEFRSNDDGEPSGTAGRPILGQINSHQLTDILIIVVRYFGGILLGTSGLIIAYKAAASEVIAASDIIDCLIESTYTVTFGYEQMNAVMRIIKEYQLTVISQEQALACKLTFSVRQSLELLVCERFSKLDFITIEKLG
jgi:uncharacterized YigZ family protein